MGLDVSAFSRLRAAPEAKLDRDGYPKDIRRYWLLRPALLDHTEKDWPGKTAGLVPGVFAFEDSTVFRAGSYSGYGEWREKLARFAGAPTAEAVWDGRVDVPFRELINFTDCDGVIGPVVSAKLAEEFAEYAERAAKVPTIISLYRAFHKAFDLARHGGAVHFH